MSAYGELACSVGCDPCVPLIGEGCNPGIGGTPLLGEGRVTTSVVTIFEGDSVICSPVGV